MIEIRKERPEDITSITDILQQAFGSPDEANLVRMLRDGNKAFISLVAVCDSQAVGHIMFSQVTIDPPHTRFNGIGLAPVAVLPKSQKGGIGSSLIRKGLEDCKQAGYDIAVVLGDHRYYQRFGFSRASDYGLGNEYGTVENFTAMELNEGALEGVSGVVKYRPEFKDANC